MSAAVEPEPVPLVVDEHGALRVAGTRLTLDTLVAAFARGDSAEEIHEQYPTVTLADVYSILTFYLRHIDQVGEYLDSREQAGENLRLRIESKFPPEGLRARLLARRTP